MTLRIGSVDNWPGFQLEELGPARYLISRYGAIVSNLNNNSNSEVPDILFCDIFHYGQPQRKEKKYAHSLKILCSGENILRKPIDWDDFVLVFSCNWFENQAKFLHMPFPILAGRADLFEKRILNSERLHFMNFVVSNSMEQFEGCALREQLFKACEKEFGIDNVHSAGKHLTNCTEKAPKTSDGYPSLNVDPKWIAQYQFTICGENQFVRGYYTEKPIQAWIAGSIPIYLTARENLQWLNEKAGIFGHSAEDIPNMITRIQSLTLSRIEEMQAQPLLRYSPAKLQRRMERRIDRMMAVWLTLRGKSSGSPTSISRGIYISEVCLSGESGASRFKFLLLQGASVTPAGIIAQGLTWNPEDVQLFRFRENCRQALNNWSDHQEYILLTKGPSKFHPKFQEKIEQLFDLKWSVCILSYSVRSWDNSQWVNTSQTAFKLDKNLILISFAMLLRKDALVALCSSSAKLMNWQEISNFCYQQPYILSYPPLMTCKGEEEDFFKQFKIAFD